MSVTPPVTLRFPPMRRNVTSPLCFPTQEYFSKNVFLFKGSQQPSFLLSLAALCVSVCTLVIIYIVGPINRKCWDADEDAAGCIFPHWAVPIYSQGSCFITLWLWCKCWGMFPLTSTGVTHTHIVLSKLQQSPLHTVTSGPDHINVGTQSVS